MDSRLTPANGRVAAMHLAGKVEAEQFLEGWSRQVVQPVADLLAAPQGGRERQLLLGEDVTVFEDQSGWSFVQSDNGYVGYVASDALAVAAAPTHVVSSFATHAYAAEDFKSPEVASLPFGARLRVLDERRKFFETDQGFVPKKHLRPRDRPFADHASIAQLHFGAPYLWGGNSTRGIDCSGLVSASLRACGVDCPADADLQLDSLGTEVSGPLARGDLVFWQGHVAVMVDAEIMIHANAHHMATVYEPYAQAVLRIAAQGDGAVIAHKRL